MNGVYYLTLACVVPSTVWLFYFVDIFMHKLQLSEDREYYILLYSKTFDCAVNF